MASENSLYEITSSETVCDNFVHSDELSIFLATKQYSKNKKLVYTFNYNPIVGDPVITWRTPDQMVVTNVAAADLIERKDLVYDVHISYQSKAVTR